jgi:hypothetical protein
VVEIPFIRSGRPEQEQQIRADQTLFLERFQPYVNQTYASCFWVGSSADGRRMCFEFYSEDGQVTRVNICIGMAVQLIAQVAVAAEIAAERAMTARETQGTA